MRALFQSIRITLSKRPLCFACGLFLILLFALLFTGWEYALLAGVISAALAAGLLILLFFCCRSHPFALTLTSVLLIVASLAFLTAHTALEYGYRQKLDRLPDKGGQALLTVTKPVSVSAYSTVCEGRLISVDGEAIGLEGIFYFPCQLSLQTGDRLSAEVTLAPIREKNADLSECYSLSQGLYFTAEVTPDSHLKTGEETVFPYSLTASIRNTLNNRLRLYLPADAFGVASALFLGDKSSLSSELNNCFRNLGISHTLAVSGLHIGILLGSLSLILKKLRLPRALHLPFLCPIALLYILTVGSASAMRAGGMFLLLLIARPFGRKRDSLTSLFTAVALICLISPFSILDIGLLLSFFSTFGILLVGQPLCQKCNRLPPLLRQTVQSLILTASATAFTLPFAIWYFGELSLISPLANLLFVPLITMMLYLIPILLIFSFFPLLAATPAYALRLLSAFTFFVARLFGSDDVFMLPLEHSLIRTVGAVCLLLCIALLCFQKTRPTVLICTLAFLIFSGICVYRQTIAVMEEHSLDSYPAGEHDTLLLTDGTRTMLCDLSDGTYSTLSQAIEYAESDHIHRVDTLLLTHYSRSQLSSVTHLLGNSHIEYLILPLPDSDHTDLATTLEERAVRSGCEVYYYSKEECLVGYHGFKLLIGLSEESNQPPNKLEVSYRGSPPVYYLTEHEAPLP